MTDLIKRSYFISLSLILRLITHTIGKIHAPWTKKFIQYGDVVEIRKVIQPGDILVTRTDGELTTLAIPGFWKHALVYVGNDKIIEAVSPKVREDWLANSCMHTDNLAVMRVVGIDALKAIKIINYAIRQIGKDYDFGLDISDDKEDFCSEIIFNGVNEAMCDGYLQAWPRMGFLTFTPDDIWRASNKLGSPLFEVIWVKCEDEKIQKDFESIEIKEAA